MFFVTLRGLSSCIYWYASQPRPIFCMVVFFVMVVLVSLSLTRTAKLSFLCLSLIHI